MRTYETTEYGTTIHCALCGNTFDSQQATDADAMEEARRFCHWEERTTPDGQTVAVCGNTEQHLEIENAGLRRVLTNILRRWELEPQGAIFPAAAMRDEVKTALGITDTATL